MSRVKALPLLILASALLVMTGCASRTVVSRVDTGEQIDLSGNWNDTDSRLVADEMITDALAHPWLTSHLRDKGANPAIIVGAMKNLTDEHIATGTFVGD